MTWVDISVDINGNSPHTGSHSLDLVFSPTTGALTSVLDGTDGGIFSLNTTTNDWSDLNGNLSTLLTNSVASNPTNINNLVAGFENNGVAVTNGSQTWTLGSTGDGGTVYFDSNNPNTIYVANDGVLDKSTTAGTLGSFKPLVPQQVQPFYPTATPYSPYYESYQNYVSDGLYPNFPLQESFRQIDTTALGNFALVVDPVNTARVLMGGTPLTPPAQGAAGQQLTATPLYESYDGGKTWNDLSVNLPLQSVTHIALAEDQGPYSADPGFNTISDLGANSYDPNTIYVTDGTSLYVTKNNGTSWVNRTANLPVSANPGKPFIISDIVVDPRNRDIAYVTASSAIGTGMGRVFVTNNAGRSWTSISGNLPDQPAWTLTIDPRTGNLYVGTDTGVYVTGNTGSSWQAFGVGLPQVSVRQIDLNLNLNTMTIATYGRGVYQLTLSSSAANAAPLHLDERRLGLDRHRLLERTHHDQCVGYVGPAEHERFGIVDDCRHHHRRNARRQFPAHQDRPGQCRPVRHEPVWRHHRHSTGQSGRAKPQRARYEHRHLRHCRKWCRPRVGFQPEPQADHPPRRRHQLERPQHRRPAQHLEQ